MHRNKYGARDPKEWALFVSLVEQAVKEGKLEQLFEMLLTIDERNTLGLRITIVEKLLSNRYPQREIQQQLNTSAATVTRGSNMLKTVDPESLAWVIQKLFDEQPSV